MADKKSIKDMADEIGIKKENLDAGLKSKHKKKVEEAIRKAHEFMTNPPKPKKK